MKTINILDYGAREGQDCTKAIQAAIDKASESGARVFVPKGIFKTGTLNLKSAGLHLEKNAVLLASENISDYTCLSFLHNEFDIVNPLIYSMNADGVSITGEGTLDLNARAFFSSERVIPDFGKELTQKQILQCTRRFEERSFLPVLFINCKNIKLEGFTTLDSPCWTYTFYDCSNIDIMRLNIENDLTIPNNDGLHFCACRDVLIKDCRISAGDDCIAITGIMDWEKPNENFIISGCRLESSSKAVLIGFMHGIVRKIVITGCIIQNSNRGICIDSSAQTGLVEDVIISDMIIETCVRAGNWWGNGEPLVIMALPHNCNFYKLPVPSRKLSANVKNIVFENIICRAENLAALIGENKNITNIALRNIMFELKSSENRSLKGEHRIDIAPAEGIFDWQSGKDSWCFFHDIGNIVCDNIIQMN